MHDRVAFGALTIEGKPFKTWQDLNSESVTLAEVRGTTPIDLIKANSAQAQVLLLDNHPDVVRAVAQGRGDAMIDALALGDVREEIDAKWSRWKACH